ncbi:MAG: hypothetical protein HY815_04515 [Candidatus Riflebacteria bacterium]|nr:hypothetical protein [Candidatus Riflebacteria bacterium]
MVVAFAVVWPIGCIQDEVVIPVALLKGKIIPVGIQSTSVTTSPTSTIITVNTTVPTVGVRIDTVGSGTNVSLINPIGPAPGSSESTFAVVTGDWTLPTKRLGARRIVARGIFYDLAWGDIYPDSFNGEFKSINLKSVTIPWNSPLRADRANHLLVKAPGRAVFVVFAEDFTIDRVPVRSVRLLLDDFTNPAVGFNVPDDGSADPQTDHAPDTSSWDLSAGDGVFTRVLTLAPGDHQYGYVINNDGFIRRDPYEEESDDSSGVRRSVIQVP